MVPAEISNAPSIIFSKFRKGAVSPWLKISHFATAPYVFYLIFLATLSRTDPGGCI